MANDRNTVVRALHDLGAGAWFGGALMGAVALNGASKDVSDPQDRARVASAGWARWSPVAAAAIGTHLLGGLGLVLANRGRINAQEGVATTSVVKTLVTGAAMATTAYSGLLGTKVAAGGRVGAEGGTVPSDQTPDEVAQAQQQLRVLQWATPILTGVIIALGSSMGEQQRPNQVAKGTVRKALRRS